MDELALLDRLQPILEEGKPARSLELNEDEQILMKGYNLLTAKPMIYVANLMMKVSWIQIHVLTIIK